MPAEVRQRFGFALSLAQMGERYEKTKILKGFSGAGVLEILEDHIGDTFRAVYTVKFEEAVFRPDALLADVVIEAATVLAYVAGQRDEKNHRPVGEVIVEPVIGPRAVNDHRWLASA